MAPLFSPRISPGLNFSSKTYYKVLHKSFNLWLLTTFNFYIGFCDFLHIWLLERQKINSLMKFSKLFWSKHLDSRSDGAADSEMRPSSLQDASAVVTVGGVPEVPGDVCVVIPQPPWLIIRDLCWHWSMCGPPPCKLGSANQHKTTDPKLILTISPRRQHLQIVSKILISTIPLISTLALNFKMFPML